MNWQLRSQETTIRVPLFIKNIQEKTKKRIVEKCIVFLFEFAKNCKQVSLDLNSMNYFYDTDVVHRKLVEYGAKVSVTHDLFVDLSKSFEEIRVNFRKSYRPLISKGLELWACEVLSHVPDDIFNEFRNLHIHVAGRETRSLRTWELQKKAVNDGNSFLVVLRDKNNKMIGCSLFDCSKTHCMYSVAAYDRDLFELPLGHVVQFRAIEKMKSLGLKWYYIGHRPFEGDLPKPTDKEIQIGRFKEGFMSNMFFRLHYCVPVR